MRNDKPYFKLRQQLFALGLTQEELCREIGRGEQYVSFRMSGKKPFTVDDAYKILELLEIPDYRFTEFFPKGGGEWNDNQRDRRTARQFRSVGG